MKRDTLLIGLLVGLCVPFIGYAILLMLDEQLTASEVQGYGFLGFSQRFLMLFAICLNLIPFQVFKRNYEDKALRGVVSATLIYCIAWAIFHGKLAILG
jgi:hypothetical protein